jgi:hypothetical protein
MKTDTLNDIVFKGWDKGTGDRKGARTLNSAMSVTVEQKLPIGMHVADSQVFFDQPDDRFIYQEKRKEHADALCVTGTVLAGIERYGRKIIHFTMDQRNPSE